MGHGSDSRWSLNAAPLKFAVGPGGMLARAGGAFTRVKGAKFDQSIVACVFDAYKEVIIIHL